MLPSDSVQIKTELASVAAHSIPHPISVSTTAHPEQIRSAKSIFYKYRKSDIRYGILWAKCQSGKTGCFHYLIRRMMKREFIQRVYIVCGSSEIELRNQANDDVLTHNHAYADKIQVIFHQDFDKTEMNLTNALVIVDESHLVQTVGQKLHEFLGRHGITMDGNPTTLNANNAFVLSVDATPYAELAALIHKETPYKKFVERMQPGVGYRGLVEFHSAGVLRATFDIAKEPNRFTALLLPHKYFLMRMNHSKVNDAAIAIILAICAEKGYKVLYYLSGKYEVAITRKEQTESKVPIAYCLEDKPTVPTVVFLYGRLRAGKVVPKRHVGGVWEGAEESNTDTVIQGLVGRMCGYEVADFPKLFVPASFLREMKGMLVEDSEMTRVLNAHQGDGDLSVDVPHGWQLLPRKATNLKPGRLTAAPPHGRTACVPLRLTWDGNQMADVYDAAKTSRERLNAYKPEGLGLLRRKIRASLADSDRYTEAQKAEIIDTINAETPEIHGRLMSADSEKDYIASYCAILKCHAAGTATEGFIQESPAVTIYFIEPGFPGLRQPGASERNIFVIFYTKATGLGDRSDIALSQRVALTTGKSIFSFDASSFDRPVAMGGCAGISRKDLQDPVKLEAGLREFMNIGRKGVLVVSREWVPCSETTIMNSARYHYVSSSDNDVERICRRLETDLGLKKKQIRVKYARSGKTHFNVKNICW